MMNKEQAERAAKLLKSMGIDVEVKKCGEAEEKAASGEDRLKQIAQEFLKAIKEGKQPETSSEDKDEATNTAQSKEETPGKASYSNHAFKGLNYLASRVNLFVEHPMLVNLSTVEVTALLSAVDSMVDKFENSNTNFMEASSEDSHVRIYLNAIFYAVDLMMKTKADAGLLSKPASTAVKVASAE